MTYSDLFFRKSILDAIPMKKGDKRLSTSAISDVILLRVTYQSQIDNFNNTMQAVLDKLKKDGFDERMRKHSRFEELCKKAEPLTDEELTEKSELERQEERFNAEFRELDSVYTESFNTKLKEDVPDIRGLSHDTFGAIIEIMDFDEKITLSLFNHNPMEIPQSEFLSMVGYHLVEKN